jgi:hypothetical protein
MIERGGKTLWVVVVSKDGGQREVGWYPDREEAMNAARVSQRLSDVYDADPD